MPALTIDVRLRRGAFELDAALEARPGEVTALVGESGAGKSTLLELVAGLLEPDDGRIALGPRVLDDTARGIHVPPRSRPVAWVAQDYALFPHLTAAANVAFGLEAQGLKRAEVTARTRATLVRFGLEALADRAPARLSGGQQQRVALARALVLEPQVLLLAEPLAALDVASRRELRGELKGILAGLPCATLLVTHQPVEALALGDRITVLESGRVTQSGTRAVFLLRPRSRYAAEFLGVNLLDGEVIERGPDGLARVRVANGVIAVPDPGRDGAVRLLIHPHEIVLSLGPSQGSARNVMRGRITELVPEPPAGERVRVWLSTTPPLVAQVTRESAEELGLAAGLEVHAAFKATGVSLVT